MCVQDHTSWLSSHVLFHTVGNSQRVKGRDGARFAIGVPRFYVYRSAGFFEKGKPIRIVNEA